MSKPTAATGARSPQFAEHEAIVGAIVERDTNHAAESMRRHLGSVTDRLPQRSRAA